MDNKKNINWFNEKMEKHQNEFTNVVEQSNKINPYKETLKIIIIYIILGGLWVYFSDHLIIEKFEDLSVIYKIELYKGLLFIVVSGIVFYFIINRSMKTIKSSINQIISGYEKLSAAYEELIAMEEELTQQNNELEQQRNALTISDQRYQLAVEGASDGIWDWDIKKGVYFFSLKWKKAFGYKDEELPNKFETWKNLLHPEDKEQAINKINNYIKSKKGIYQNIYRLRCKNGTYRWILSRGKGVWDDKGQPIRIAGSHTDITDHIRLQKTLQREKELTEGIIKEAFMIIIVLDKTGRIKQFNPFAERVTGYKKEEIIGKNLSEFTDIQCLKDNINDCLYKFLANKPLRNYESTFKCKNGKKINVLWNLNALNTIENNVRIVAIGIDITDRIKMLRQLHKLAYYDVLTGLPNRLMFKKYMDDLLVDVKQTNEQFALIYVDVDNFKHINDTMGHMAGDELIKYMADILKKHIKSPHLVARLSGDEFIIVLRNINEINFVKKQLNKLIKSIRPAWIINNQKFFISISMGIAIYPKDGKDTTNLLQNADTAMFHQKEKGKDGYSFYTPTMREKTINYIQLSNQLRSAIKNEEFLLYYQPQIDLKKKKVVGVEALIRWIHPIKGMISPDEFIPLAEKMGYIHDIGLWVIKVVCNQKKQWEKEGISHIKMAINLSSKSLTNPNTINSIKKIIEENHNNCYGIELEITETAVMENIEIAIESLKELKNYGFTIALDDFGTGYSSLTYLQKLPIDVLKIDREFIKKISKHEKRHILITSLIELAHKLDIQVVAEGIETKEQAEILTKYKCDIGQGYFYSKPLPVEEIYRKIALDGFTKK